MLHNTCPHLLLHTIQLSFFHTAPYWTLLRAHLWCLLETVQVCRYLTISFLDASVATLSSSALASPFFQGDMSTVKFQSLPWTSTFVTLFYARCLMITIRGRSLPNSSTVSGRFLYHVTTRPLALFTFAHGLVTAYGFMYYKMKKAMRSKTKKLHVPSYLHNMTNKNCQNISFCFFSIIDHFVWNLLFHFGSG